MWAASHNNVGRRACGHTLFRPASLLSCGAIVAPHHQKELFHTQQKCHGLQPAPRQRVLYATLHTDEPSVHIDFSDVECELLAQIKAVIDENALPEGRMPTRKQFQQAGQTALLKRISAASGLRRLAPGLNLLQGAKMLPTPSKHTLESLQAALRTFGKDRGVPKGVMPSVKQLKEANQLDIVAAIQRHGGSKPVAASMRLRVVTKKHIHGSCRKFESLESVVQAVQAFVQQHALAEHANDMPSSSMLRRAGQSHLSNSICRHGIKKVAAAADLQYKRLRGLQRGLQHGHKVQKHDLGSLQAAVSAFIQEHHVDEGVMPSTLQLKEANRQDIVHGLRKHGGRQRVAASMQLHCVDPGMKFPTTALAVAVIC